MDINLGLGSEITNAPSPEPSGEPAESSVQTETVEETQTETGIEAAESSSSLTGTDSEISEEDKLTAYAADPNTPAFARKKIEEAIAYAGRLKTEKSDFESKYSELNEKFSAYEGKEVVDPTEIERYKKADESLFKLQSFSATAETADEFLKELNPALHKEYQNRAAWNALYKDDGKPDLENWQAVVDRGLGYDGTGERVLAEDVLRIAEAIRSGEMTREDIDAFTGDVESNAHRRAMQTQAEQLKSQTEFQEKQIRTTEVGNVTTALKQQIVSQALPTVQKFKLSHSPDDPKIATEFKAELSRKLDALEQEMWSKNKHFAEVGKALEIVSQPRGLTPQQAAAEVQSLLSNPQYQRLVAAGISELNSEIERVLAKEAYTYKLLMMGYEAENSKKNNAREIIKNPNQSANLPNLTPEQIQAMNGRERTQTAMERFTAAARQEPNRLGG
jgi:hypothetical protein